MSVFLQRAGKSLPRATAPVSNRLPDRRVPERETPLDVDELEDTQPSVLLPDDDDFCDAPTLPGFRLRADGKIERTLSGAPEGQWDRALRAVAVAVKRVFAAHAIHRSS